MSRLSKNDIADLFLRKPYEKNHMAFALVVINQTFPLYSEGFS